jgi:hypothetical protein
MITYAVVVKTTTSVVVVGSGVSVVLSGVGVGVMGSTELVVVSVADAVAESVVDEA